MDPNTVQLLSTGEDTTTQLTGIAKLLAEYGSEVVILAVFILLLLLVMGYMFKTFDKMFTKQQENMDKLFDKLLSGATPAPAVKEPTPEPTTPATTVVPPEEEVSNEFYVIKAFKSACRAVISELKCDRVAIYVFHNGNRSTFGYRFIKMSCIYEETTNGTNTGRGMLSHQGIPMAAFSSIIDCLINNDEYIVGNAYDHGIVSADEKILNFIAGSLVKALFFSAVKDPHSELIAFIVAEFNKEQDFSEIAWYNQCKKALANMTTNIFPILTGGDARQLIKN